MARKTQISKEVILEAALKMLIRDGYSAINIKTLSKEIGCSTQPLVWHFENMEGLRKALSEYALNYANSKMRPSAGNVAALIKRISKEFAISEENAGRYLQNTIIYTHGIATLAATGIINASEKEMMQLVNRAADAFLVQEGVLLEKIPHREEAQK